MDGGRTSFSLQGDLTEVTKSAYAFSSLSYLPFSLPLLVPSSTLPVDVMSVLETDLSHWLTNTGILGRGTRKLSGTSQQEVHSHGKLHASLYDIISSWRKDAGKRGLLYDILPSWRKGAGKRGLLYDIIPLWRKGAGRRGLKCVVAELPLVLCTVVSKSTWCLMSTVSTHDV